MISFHPSSVPDFGQVFGGRMVMTSQAPQCDAREEETLLATNDTAAASISVDGERWQQSTVWAGMKWLDRAMSARFSTSSDLDGLPLNSLIPTPSRSVARRQSCLSCLQPAS